MNFGVNLYKYLKAFIYFIFLNIFKMFALLNHLFNRKKMS